jgi:hypothetical protein
MESGKGIYILIKNDIPGNVHTPRGHLKTLKPFMPCTVSKEYTLCRSELQLSIIIGAQIGPTSTAKHTKGRIVWRSVKKALKRCFPIESFCREAID